MQGFLLDAHLPTAVVVGVRAARRACRIEHVASWRNGALRTAHDEEILREALDADLVLVTYDVDTIPAIVYTWLAEGRPTPGVAFLTRRAVAQEDVGGIVRVLVSVYDDPPSLDPAHPVLYLRP